MDYEQLAEVYEKLESNSKRLNKTHHIAELLRITKEADLGMIALLIQGNIFPSYDERKIGVAGKSIIKALHTATGKSADAIETLFAKKGDLGKVAEEITGKKSQQTLFSQKLTVKKVFSNLQKIASIEGQGAVDKKTQLLSELLTSASPIEAKYIVRTALEDLRVGVGDGTLRDAIAWAYFTIPGILIKCERCEKLTPVKICPYCGQENKKKKETTEERNAYNEILEAVQEAYDLVNDFGKVAVIAKKEGLKGLQSVSLASGTPLKVMLYQKAKHFEDAFERVGKPAQIESKYDGFRIQAHKHNGKVTLYTRRLEDVSLQFPEVVELLKDNVNAQNFIIDAEIIGIDKHTKHYLPFQHISQRIKRKYDVEKLVKEIPVIVRIFDMMELNGKSYLKEPFKKRREALEKIVKNIANKVGVAEHKIVSDVKEAQEFYEKSLEMGNEGAMMKNLDAPYKPGSRVGYGVKIKPSMETFDLVIVGAEWGEGKRSGWLTSFILACKDDDSFLEIGKVGTGFKEKTEEGVSFDQMTKLLKPLIISEKGKSVKVKSKIILEVEFEEIQKSPSYSSGYALRFPRVKQIREDKPLDEISSLEYVKDVFNS